MYPSEVKERKKLNSTHILILVVVIALGYLAFSPSENKVKEADGLVIATSTAEIVSVGEYTYSFDGVDWLFEDQGENYLGIPVSIVRIKFDNFKRNDIDISVLPYRLGLYSGDCRVIEKGEALTKARCLYSGTASELAVYLEGDIVLVKSRVVSEGSSDNDEPMITLLEINLNEVVQ